MFKNLFKLGKDSSVSDSAVLEKFEDENGSSNDSLMKVEDYGNMIPNLSYTQDEVISIFESIHRKYFMNSQSHEPLRVEFEFLVQCNFRQDVLDHRIKELLMQRFVVSREISRLIQLNHNDYMEEVTRLVNIQSSLKKACNLSLQSRNNLQISLQGIKDGGLGILLSFRKMERLRSSLKQLSLVKTLHRADLWLKERLNIGHYKEAAHCCMIFLRALNSFHNYSCCIDLSSKLLDIQQVITTKLDANLVDLCRKFEPEKYLNLMAAYTLLGKGEAAIDKLALNYVSQIKVVAKKVFKIHYCDLPDEYCQREVYAIISCIGTVENSSQLLTSSFMSLCDVFSEILFSYSDISSYHDMLPDHMLNEHFISRSLLDRKFNQGKNLVWNETEKILCSLLNVHKYDNFPYDNLIRIIGIVNVYVHTGRSFCQYTTNCLSDTIRVISLNYFNHYHEFRMEDLKLFLENESWELCPLPINFSLGQLTEFSFLNNNKFDSISYDFEVQFDISNLQSRMSLLRVFRQSESESTSSQDPLSLESSNVNETSDSYRNNSNNLLTSNTTLITLKYIGRYIQFMISLPNIGLELFHFICQVYKYYFYVTNLYFADLRSFHFENSIIEIHGMEAHENYFSTKLNTVLSQIESETDLHKKGLIPNFSIFHQLLSEDNILYGLKQRIVGVESLLFLSEQLIRLKPTIESYFRRNNLLSSLDCVSSFYSQCIEISFGLRRPVYCGIARYTLNYEQISQKMALTKWDVKELLSQRNPYIDLIIKEFENMTYIFDKISLTIPIPNLVKTMILEECCSLTNKLLVEGFAYGKKCTHQGRASMLFDFREFVAEIEKNSKVRVPQKSYVEDYIHAFYLDEDEIDKWTQEHKEYSLYQLNALINCKTTFKRRTTHKLLNLIEKGTPPH